MKLTTPKRNELGDAMFGLPGQRKYPVFDRAHAANAKARVTQQLGMGNISPAQAAQVTEKADGVLKR